ncbi:hypothetical protein JW964_02480 [candidate division KSB1 bacterium]|nr:hypothetical protein [candidate division KSB1 bacterium]
MSGFTPILQNINERLDLPQPTKSRIILEIAADLEDAFQYYCDKGLSEELARRQAIEKFDITDEALAELVTVHQSIFRRFLDKLTAQAQSRWERIVLTIVLIFIAAVGGKTVFTSQFIRQASAFVWPILGIFGAILTISVVKIYQLYIKKDHHIKRIHRGLSSIAILGGLNIFLGIFGYVIELYASRQTPMYSGAFDVITTAVENDSEFFFQAVERVANCASMAMVCTLVTIMTALIGFIFLNKIQQIEQAEAAFLLED